MASSFDITKLLPPRYVDKTARGLIKNLFNRQLTKLDTVPLYGYVGGETAIVAISSQPAVPNMATQVPYFVPAPYVLGGYEQDDYVVNDFVGFVPVQWVNGSSNVVTWVNGSNNPVIWKL